MEKPRVTSKNESFENATWITTASGSDGEGSPKYLTNCENYDYLGSPTVEVRILPTLQFYSESLLFGLSGELSVRK